MCMKAQKKPVTWLLTLSHISKTHHYNIQPHWLSHVFISMLITKLSYWVNNNKSLLSHSSIEKKIKITYYKMLSQKECCSKRLTRSNTIIALRKSSSTRASDFSQFDHFHQRRNEFINFFQEKLKVIRTSMAPLSSLHNFHESPICEEWMLQQFSSKTISMFAGSIHTSLFSDKESLIRTDQDVFHAICISNVSKNATLPSQGYECMSRTKVT